MIRVEMIITLVIKSILLENSFRAENKILINELK